MKYVKKSVLVCCVMVSAIHAKADDMGSYPQSVNYAAPAEDMQTRSLFGQPSVARPFEVEAQFSESDFEDRPYYKDFEFVIVVNKATQGSDRQTVKIYKNQQLVKIDDIRAYLEKVRNQDIQDLQVLDDKMKKAGLFSFGYKKNLDGRMDVLRQKISERDSRLIELSYKAREDGVYMISSGRDQFEKKGEHHSQKDSWSVTPAGYFVPQAFNIRHKSESYSNSLCDSALGKLASSVMQKELCTYMDFAVFFNEGIALHKAIPGTEDALGEKASGGCVRMPGALAEYVYLNLLEAKGRPVPQINKDGTPVLDDQGRVNYITQSSSVWGNIEARSALIIVESVVR